MSVVQPAASNRRSIYAWAMNDWANSTFATTILAGFFPIFFKQYWSAGQDAATSTYHLGNANGIASIVVLVLAPILGAIADRGGAKKHFMFFFTMMGVIGSAALYLIGKGEWFNAALVFVVGSIGFNGSLIFYDSMIVDVAREEEFDRVSALGYALGYLGGGLLFAVNVAMTLKPAWFGLANAAEAVRWSFILVAIWWAVFSMPLFLIVKERFPASAVSWTGAVTGGLRQLIQTFHEIRRLRVVLLFLLAYWLYIDGVDTIIRMAVDYGLALGFPANSLIVALLVTQFVGFPAAVAFGRLAEKIGTRQAIYLGIVVYMGVTVWAFFLSNVTEFYAMAITIGMVQGGVQSLSRSYYARLIPAEKAAEFFGFYNMLGKFAAVIGPFLVAYTAMMTGSSRASILSILILFIAGAALLWFVRPEIKQA